MRGYGFYRRALVVTALTLITLAGLMGRLAQVQLFQHDQFAAVATAQRYHTVRLDAPRGEILDRWGRKLVSNRSAYRLQLLYPAYVVGGGPNTELIRQLASLLGLDAARLEEEARKKIASRRFYEPLVLKDDLSAREIALLVELRSELPGIYIDEHPVRHYLRGSLAAHLLGHLGQIDSQEEASRVGAAYRVGDLVGRMGVEKQYDSLLRGTPGLLQVEVDAGFRPTGQTSRRAEVLPGQSLQLTLDLDLQQTVQGALVSTLQYIQTHPDASGITFRKADVGAAVVMDVRTGGILAMASYPTFDPNSPGSGGAFFNRAISGEYQPGSTFKMLSAAAALKYGVVKPDEHILCTGTYDKLEPKKDWKPEGHGLMDTVSALANSCNIYFYEMGYRLGVERLADTAALFGFGQRTGIDLPDEAEGWIPDAARRRADRDPGAWNGGKLLSAAIGQGPTATPVQVARYAAMLANGGRKVRPHVVSAIVDAGGKVVKELTPPPDGNLQVPPEIFRTILEGMKAVTEWGTSAGAFRGLPFKVAGKTGSAEVVGPGLCAGETKCTFGVYVAFAPAENPEIAVAVVGERAGHGDFMNPVARAVVAQYFKVALAYDDPLYTMGILPRPAGIRQSPP